MAQMTATALRAPLPATAGWRFSRMALQRRQLALPRSSGIFAGMSTITAILEASEDGSLHLPLPAELKGARIRVVAELEAVSAGTTAVRTARDARDWWEKVGPLPADEAEAFAHDIEAGRTAMNRKPDDRWA